jgi:hypothetical protein
MFKLSKQQHDVFRINAISKAKMRAIEFTSGNFSKELEARKTTATEITDKVFAFAARFNIKSEINVQRLIAWEMLYHFLRFDPLPEEWLEILEFPSREEDLKVKYFQKHIMNTLKKTTTT